MSIASAVLYSLAALVYLDNLRCVYRAHTGKDAGKHHRSASPVLAPLLAGIATGILFRQTWPAVLVVAGGLVVDFGSWFVLASVLRGRRRA